MNASRQKFPSKLDLVMSSARSSLFLISLFTTTIGVLWIVRKKHKQHPQPIDSSHHPEPPPAQTSLQQSSQTRPSTKSLLLTPQEGEQKQEGKSAWKILKGFVEIGLALVLCLIPLALIDIWGVNLHANYIYSLPPPRGFEHTVDVPIQSGLGPCYESLSTTIVKGRLFSRGCSKTNTTLIVTITQIKKVTATESTLTGTLEFIVPKKIQSALCVYAKSTHGAACHGLGQPVATVVTNSFYQLKPAYNSLPITLNVSDILGHVSSSTTIPLEKFFPPFDIDPEDPWVHLIIPLSLTVTSEGRQYPEDWYWSDSVISIELPSQLFIDTPQNYKAIGGFLPFNLTVLATTATDTLDLVFTPETNFNDPAEEFHSLNFFAQHTQGFKVLVYGTALLIPLALLLLLIHTLFSEWKRKKQNELPALLLNVLIAILTLIAIRQVLVPPDLTGLLTRLDLWLVTSAMVLLMLICVRYSAGIAWKYWHIARQLQKPHVTTTSE